MGNEIQNGHLLMDFLQNVTCCSYKTSGDGFIPQAVRFALAFGKGIHLMGWIILICAIVLVIAAIAAADIDISDLLPF